VYEEAMSRYQPVDHGIISNEEALISVKNLGLEKMVA
jgi:hypothetical protein